MENLIQAADINQRNEAAAVVAEGIMRARRRASTSRAYSSGQNVFMTWLNDHHRADVVNGAIVLPLNEEHVLQFFGDVCNKEGVYKSASTISHYKSSISSLYRDNNMIMSQDLEKKLHDFGCGYKRTIQDLKQSGDIPMREGKLPLPIQGYKCLCRLALNPNVEGEVAQNNHLIIYTHLYLLLQWNTMSRTESIAHCNYSHFKWNGDCMIVQLPRHKGDPEGLRSYEKHIYANPHDLLICPVLAMGLHIVCTSFRENNAVFAGSSIESKFSKWLLSKLQHMTEAELHEIGVPPADLGTHSIRKGVATFIQGLIGGPNMVALFIRMGWTLGNVQQRYLFEGEGSDQLLGRSACGLDINDVSFTSLPPHFDNNEVILTVQQWNEVIPYYQDYPHCFRTALPYLLASVVHASEWLIYLTTILILTAPTIALIITID